MSNESAAQMEELLKGVKPSLLSKGLNMLAANQDKNFMSVDKRFDDLNKKVDRVLNLLEQNKRDTDNRIEEIKQDSLKRDINNKENIDARFKKIEESTETIAYFKKHPNFIKYIAVAILLIISYILGHKEILDKFINL
jgi:hypothetical protein